MAILPNKRSLMTLYTKSDVMSHYVRIVLAEKGVPYDNNNVEIRNKPEDLLELNPYASVPTLVDRELALYEPNIIVEYLDERFPHPPLMPVYPVARAKARLVLYRFEREWNPLIRKLETSKIHDPKIAKELSRLVVQLLPIFNASTYFLGEEFTLVDCYIAPVFWRMSLWGLSFTPQESKAINKYAERVFKRDSFQASLTEVEQEMRHLANAESA